jgi:hypothetical protein
VVREDDVDERVEVSHRARLVVCSGDERENSVPHIPQVRADVGIELPSGSDLAQMYGRLEPRRMSESARRKGGVGELQ